MYIYYFLLIYFLISASFVSVLKGFDKRLVLTVLLAAGVLFVMALRDITVGVDLERYVDFFEGVDRYDVADGIYEPGYMYFLMLLKMLGVSAQGYIAVVSLFIVFSFSVFIYRYSKYILFSFYLHVTLGLFAYSMTTIRQTLAICFILFAVKYILDRKLLGFLVLVGVAAAFHYSALIFLPLYFLQGFKVNSYKKIFFLFSGLTVLVASDSLLLDGVLFASPEKYISLYVDAQIDYGINPLVILLSATIPVGIALIWRLSGSGIRDVTNTDSFFFVCTVLLLLFVLYSMRIHMLIRLSSYFVPAYIILIPNAIAGFKRHNNRLMAGGLVAIFSFIYFVIGNTDGILQIDRYKFFF